MSLIYKILSTELWSKALAAGALDGAPVDIRDGFIHFSAAHQLRETAAKHFAGLDDLVLVAVEADRLGAALKWEPSRGGDLFPHLYGPLDPALATSATRLERDSRGSCIFPAEIP